MKKVFCVVQQSSNKINLYVYTLKMEDKKITKKLLTGIIKKNYKTNYKIINEIILTFSNYQNLTKETLKNYGSIIRQKLREYSYEEVPIDIVFDIEGTFSSQFSLPKLNGKVLASAYNNEIERSFGNLLSEYIISSKKYINNNKGYTFELLATKEEYYNNMIEIFNSSKLKIENCVYLPSIFSNITNIEGAKNAGILMDDNKTYLFITQKGIVINYLVIPIGYESINKDIMEQFQVEKVDVRRYREENISKIALKRVIYRTMRKVIEQLYFLMLSDSNNIDDEYVAIVNKIYIYSLDGKTKELLLGFPSMLRKRFDIYKLETEYRYQLFIDSYYNNQKNFKFFPTKVKYEKK